MVEYYNLIMKKKFVNIIKYIMQKQIILQLLFIILNILI